MGKKKEVVAPEQQTPAVTEVVEQVVLKKQKPVVQYRNAPAYIPNFANIEVGRRAVVIPVDHPNEDGLLVNGMEAWTSDVIWHNAETGEFETLNTRYVREQ